MDIVYMGTPEFACPPLEALAESQHRIKAVVTGRDKPAGRGRKLLSTPVRQLAEQLGRTVLTPKSLKSRELHAALAEVQADVFVVVAFRILPESLFMLPRLGSINIHGSLLPKYRGAAPINWALINGETTTGLSSFFLKPEVDTGDIISQTEIAIEPSDTFDSLYRRMSEAAGPFLLDTLQLIETGRTVPVPQTDDLASPAPKLTSADALIDFGFPAAKVCNFVRGLSTKPGAYTYFRGKAVKLHGCRPAADVDLPAGTRPGSVIPHKKRLLIACADGALEITRIVPQGKKEMDGQSFKNGFRPEPEDIFGEITQEVSGNQ